jgi:DNA-binding XRE family transcriptional regulator
MRLAKMINDAVKKIISEKRTLTLGQIIEAICSGQLRQECRLDKHHFAELVGTTRKTIRDLESLEYIPKLQTVLNIAVALNIKIAMPKPYAGDSWK